MVETEHTMSKYFTDAIIRKGYVPAEFIDKVSERADENVRRYYSLLRSTKAEGIENLISAIHESTFTTCHSHSHHHYTTGTLEHCLGVYDEMKALSAGKDIPESEIILVALLHDIGKGHSKEFSAFSGHHPERSAKIVRRYLRHVSPEVLSAIRYHQHHCPGHPLQNLVCDADHSDASKCNRAVQFFKSL